MSTPNFTISQLKNKSGHPIQVKFFPHTDMESVITMDDGAAIPCDVLFESPGKPIRFTVHRTTVLKQPVGVTLWYVEVEDADGNPKNQVLYVVDPEVNYTPKRADPATDPDQLVTLSIDYSGDGVVIVGTGDII